jgi:hypothetical protein
MKNLEFLEDLIKITLPAAAVMYAMFLVIKSFLNKEFERRLVEFKLKSSESITPVRLQAYERMALFLERISPANLLIRLNQPQANVAQFQHLLISQIREEMSHNFSQQVYMSDQSWQLIKIAMDDIINLINAAAQELQPEAKGVELGKKVFEIVLKREVDPAKQALTFLKAEIQRLF